MAHNQKKRRDVGDSTGDRLDGQADSGLEVSRSQRKRDSAALQVLGEKLLALSGSKRGQLPLGPDLAEALNDYPRLKTHEAKRRQMQYIGRLMRDAQTSGQLVEITYIWEQLPD